MEQIALNQGNKIIAEFMGFKVKYEHDEQASIALTENIYMPIESWAKYQWDWGWLMQVVQKIMNMETTVTISNSSCEIRTHLRGYNSTAYSETSTIKAVWYAVIEFINWHNENKK